MNKDINSIRLIQRDVQAIKQAFSTCFSTKDQLWIFGSRVYPEKRGGDIDLYVEIALENRHNPSDLFAKKRTFWGLMQEALGEQKIDIVLNYGQDNLSIYKVARDEGIHLL